MDPPNGPKLCADLQWGASGAPPAHDATFGGRPGSGVKTRNCEAPP